MRTYASSRVKRKSFYRKSEVQMSLLISGGHIDWCTKTDKNGTQKWRLQSIQSSKKGAWNLSANNSETVAHKDLRLGQIVYILVFYNVSFSLPVPLDGFQFVFLLRNSENDQLLQFMGNSTARNFFWLLFARGHAYRSWSWGKSPALALNKSLVGESRNQYQYFSLLKHAPEIDLVTVFDAILTSR